MKTISYFILCISVVFLTVSFGHSQDKLRTIDEKNPVYNHPNAPIEIIGRSIGEKNFSRGEQLLVGQDWLKDLRLTVKNISSKTIVYFYIELVIPKSERLKTIVPIPVRFGTPLFILSDNGMVYIDKKNREVLRPGETVTVSVKENALKAFTQHLRKFDEENFDSVNMDIRDVEFDDFSGWSLGNKWQRDSAGKIISQQKSEKSREPVFFDWLSFFLPIKAISQWNKQLLSSQPAQEVFFQTITD